MRHSGRKVTSGPRRPVNRGNLGQDDPHDAIDLELLRLWIGFSRLFETLWDGARAERPRKSAAHKPPRRKAA